MRKAVAFYHRHFTVFIVSFFMFLFLWVLTNQISDYYQDVHDILWDPSQKIETMKNICRVLPMGLELSLLLGVIAVPVFVLVSGWLGKLFRRNSFGYLCSFVFGATLLFPCFFYINMGLAGVFAIPFGDLQLPIWVLVPYWSFWTCILTLLMVLLNGLLFGFIYKLTSKLFKLFANVMTATNRPHAR